MGRLRAASSSSAWRSPRVRMWLSPIQAAQTAPIPEMKDATAHRIAPGPHAPQGSSPWRRCCCTNSASSHQNSGILSGTSGRSPFLAVQVPRHPVLLASDMPWSWAIRSSSSSYAHAHSGIFSGRAFGPFGLVALRVEVPRSTSARTNRGCSHRHLPLPVRCRGRAARRTAGRSGSRATSRRGLPRSRATSTWPSSSCLPGSRCRRGWCCPSRCRRSTGRRSGSCRSRAGCAGACRCSRSRRSRSGWGRGRRPSSTPGWRGRSSRRPAPRRGRRRAASAGTGGSATCGSAFIERRQ